MTDEPDDKGEGQKDQNKALVDIKINDIFGLRQVGKQIRPAFNHLIDAVAKGVGGISEPLLADLRRRRERRMLAKSIRPERARADPSIRRSDFEASAASCAPISSLRRHRPTREGVAFEAFEQARLLASEDEGGRPGARPLRPTPAKNRSTWPG
ncbi:MAG: hypothetical protein R3D43_07310 [Tepidamorphaceae bacterium]